MPVCAYVQQQLMLRSLRRRAFESAASPPAFHKHARACSLLQTIRMGVGFAAVTKVLGPRDLRRFLLEEPGLYFSILRY